LARSIGVASVALCPPGALAQQLPTDPEEKDSSVPSDVLESAPDAARGGRAALFEGGPIDGLRSGWRGLNDELEAAAGLRFKLSHTMLYQSSFGTSENAQAGAGDLDLVAEWVLLEDDAGNSGRLLVKTEYRYQIGSRTPSRLNREIGTFTPTADAFNERTVSVKELFWEQRLADDRVVISFGKVNPDDYYNALEYSSPNRTFVNEVVSDNAAMRLPRRGVGVNATVRPDDGWYVSAGVHDANGSPSTGDFRSIDEWEFGYVGEVGLTPTFEGLGAGRYAVMGWYTDERTERGTDDGSGFALLAEQELGGGLAVFGRFGWSDGDTTLGERAFMGGVAFTEPFGRADDFFGIAGAVTDPSRSRLDEEYVLEAIYRVQLTQAQQLSLGVQGIFDPAFTDDDAVGVFSARWRVDF
jgi:carbohydrate-selective porin OprB